MRLEYSRSCDIFHKRKTTMHNSRGFAYVFTAALKVRHTSFWLFSWLFREEATILLLVMTLESVMFVINSAAQAAYCWRDVSFVVLCVIFFSFPPHAAWQHEGRKHTLRYTTSGSQALVAGKSAKHFIFKDVKVQ